MKYRKPAKHENIILRSITSISQCWKSTNKWLNRPLFTLFHRQVITRDLLMFLLISAILFYCSFGLYKALSVTQPRPPREAKIILVPEVPTEQWSYIKKFETSSSYITQPTVTPPNNATPYIHATTEQKHILEKIRNALNMPNTATLEQVHNQLPFDNTEEIIDPATVTESNAQAITSIDNDKDKEVAEKFAQEQNSQGLKAASPTSKDNKNVDKSSEKKIPDPANDKLEKKQTKQENKTTFVCGTWDEKTANKYLSFAQKYNKAKITGLSTKKTAKGVQLVITGNFNIDDKARFARFYNIKCQ